MFLSLIMLYLGGVLSNYAELRVYRTASSTKREDLLLAVQWPLQIWRWVRGE